MVIPPQRWVDAHDYELTFDATISYWGCFFRAAVRSSLGRWRLHELPQLTHHRFLEYHTWEKSLLTALVSSSDYMKFIKSFAEEGHFKGAAIKPKTKRKIVRICTAILYVSGRSLTRAKVVLYIDESRGGCPQLRRRHLEEGHLKLGLVRYPEGLPVFRFFFNCTIQAQLRCFYSIYSSSAAEYFPFESSSFLWFNISWPFVLEQVIEVTRMS